MRPSLKRIFSANSAVSRLGGENAEGFAESDKNSLVGTGETNQSPS